jgi:hypothetical protein
VLFLARQDTVDRKFAANLIYEYLLTKPLIPSLGKVIETIKTENYTIQTSDRGKNVVANSASPIVFTLPTASDFGADCSLFIQNTGAGLLTLNGTVPCSGQSTSYRREPGQYGRER